MLRHCEIISKLFSLFKVGEHTSYRIVPKAHCNVHFFDGNIRNTILIDIITNGVKERNSIRGRYPRPSRKQALKRRKGQTSWADISIRNFDQIQDDRQELSRSQYLRQDISERISISDIFRAAPISSTLTNASISVSTKQLFSSPTWTHFWNYYRRDLFSPRHSPMLSVLWRSLVTHHLLCMCLRSHPMRCLQREINTEENTAASMPNN